MNLFKAILILLIAFVSTEVFAGNPVNVEQFINHKNWNFIENKGQLASRDVKYYGRQGDVSVYCKSGMISFVFAKVVQIDSFWGKENNGQFSDATNRLSGKYSPLKREPRVFRAELERGINHPSKISANRIDLVLIGSSPNTQIIPSDRQDYYENYYTGNTPREGITNVQTYKTITYKSIYPNIDMVLHAGNNGMEYEFWVMPGGNPKDIQLEWDGTDTVKKLANGNIYHGSDLGNIRESAPLSYLINENSGQSSLDNRSKKLIVGSQFCLINKCIGFCTDDYDKSKTLFIDPSLVWATYFGGSELEYGNGITTDGFGNVIITGETSSNTGIASSGAYQTSYADSGDAFIAKFSSTGQRLWSSYFGGSGYDAGCSIVADAMGSIFIDGNTSSKTGIASPGAYQTINGEIINDTLRTFGVFIAKFSALGARVWGTYFGVGAFATGNSIAVDNSGNVLITGITLSTSGIATSGTYMTSMSADTHASFIAEFDSFGNKAWGTYVSNVSSFSIAIDRSQNIFISGDTYNDTGFASAGAFQTKFGGGNFDAFISKFSHSGGRLWSTYFGGSGDDEAYSIATDNAGNAYITGETTSDTGIAGSGALQSSPGGAFIAKFTPSGRRAWGTYFGAKASCIGYAITIASQNWVYIIGDAASDSGIATPGAYQQYGNRSAFIERFSTFGDRPWGSLYGNNYTNTTSIISDAFNNVYFTGYTFDSSLATSGTYQTHYDGFDAFIAKFNFTYKYDAGIIGFPSPIDTVCPGSQLVSATFKNYGNEPLDSVMIYWQVNDVAQKPVHWFGNLSPDSSQTINLGSYNLLPNTNNTITAWTSMPDGFNDSVPENDTASVIIRSQRPIPLTGPPQNICKGAVIQLGASSIPGRMYSWTSKPSGFISNLSSPIDSPKISTEYYLKETVAATGCNDSDSVKVTVIPRPDVIFDVAHVQGYQYQFTATSPNYPGYQYHWDFGDLSSTSSDTASGYNVSHIYPQNGKYMVYLTIALPGFCTVVDSYLVVVNEPFSLNIYPNPFSLQTDINYILASPAHVKISVTDDIGRQIGTLVDKQLNPGEYDTWFNGEFWKTRPGMYFVLFQLDDKLIVKKIIQIDSIYH